MPFTLVPEYSPVRAVVLALPYRGGDWDASYNAAMRCYRGMVETLLREDAGVEVWLLAKAGADLIEWQSGLTLPAGAARRLLILTDIDYDDTWIRDYGPLTLAAANGDIEFKSFTFNGWGGKYLATNDNQVAAQLAPYLGQSVTELAYVLEGGALEVNTAGVLLVNADCVVDEQRNAKLDRAAMQDVLQAELGVSEVEWVADIALTGDDTDGHIDTIARFVADDIIVACDRNAAHHDAAALDALNTQLEAICRRRGWQLVRLPVPVVHSAVDGRLLPATYANFLLCNGILFVPIYDQPEDAAALRILKEALPMYRTVGIRCEALLEQHGSLHCATMQIPEVPGDI
ncbi:MAG: agmatine deiminase family protein [Gammaproteobacteria bacterium]|nr:agmatine deiminase family protein [Gammaproteobacteria bacterium]